MCGLDPADVLMVEDDPGDALIAAVGRLVMTCTRDFGCAFRGVDAFPDHAPVGSQEIMVACAFSSPGIAANVGVPVAGHLERLGHDVVGFDRVDGVDLLNLADVRHAAAGCGAVVHLGALAHDTAGSREQIMAVNVLGTWHVLLAAEAAGVTRVVHFSSAQVFGIAEGERLPDYFPVDDAHPRRAMRPYGLSKCLAEDLCAGFTARTGIASVSLRPVWVWDPGQYQRVETRWRSEPRSEWEPFWEYGAFVDVRDVTTAVEQALTVPLAGHHRALLCAATSRVPLPASQ